MGALAIALVLTVALAASAAAQAPASGTGISPYGLVTGDTSGVEGRFTVAKRNHVNLRADYAWGKGSSAFYVSVLEAF